jgi:hypothetical protein
MCSTDATAVRLSLKRACSVLLLLLEFPFEGFLEVAQTVSRTKVLVILREPRAIEPELTGCTQFNPFR